MTPTAASLPPADGGLAELAARHRLQPDQTAALGRYVDLLCAWPRANVTGLRDRSAVVTTLIGDSLALRGALPLGWDAPAPWLDLGSGGGIPGIPLAVALDDIRVTLLDSVAKKCAFLEEAVRAAGLEGRAEVVCARSEAFAAAGSAGREAHTVVLARAVAPLAVLVELASPLLAPGGVLVASKTWAALREEAPAAAATAALCGVLAEPPVPLPLSPLEDAVAAMYRKVGATPAGLPRRPGLAAKRPLAR